MANPRGPGGESSGGPSLGDCGNICEGNLVFRVIFRKFMHRWFQICAQLGSDNVSFLHYRPPKLKYGFFRGSFSQPTSKSKWVGELDYCEEALPVVSDVLPHLKDQPWQEEKEQQRKEPRCKIDLLHHVLPGSQLSKVGVPIIKSIQQHLCHLALLVLCEPDWNEMKYCCFAWESLTCPVSPSARCPAWCRGPWSWRGGTPDHRVRSAAPWTHRPTAPLRTWNPYCKNVLLNSGKLFNNWEFMKEYPAFSFALSSSVLSHPGSGLQPFLTKWGRKTSEKDSFG